MQASKNQVTKWQLQTLVLITIMKTINFTTGTMVTNSVLVLLPYGNIVMMDRYLPGIMKAIEQDVSLLEIIDQIEAQPD